MPLITSRIPFEEQDPEDWRKLWEKAQREQDSKKLDAIIKQVNRLLTERDRQCAALAAKSAVG
jgi:hypothetical protein